MRHQVFTARDESPEKLDLRLRTLRLEAEELDWGVEASQAMPEDGLWVRCVLPRSPYS